MAESQNFSHSTTTFAPKTQVHTYCKKENYVLYLRV